MGISGGKVLRARSLPVLGQVLGRASPTLPLTVTRAQQNREHSGIFGIPSARCYSEDMSVDLAKLKAAYGKAAALVIEDPVYLPIFERIEREIALFEKQDDVIRRAKAIAESYKAVV